jgi:hypothetical protein
VRLSRISLPPSRSRIPSAVSQQLDAKVQENVEQHESNRPALVKEGVFGKVNRLGSFRRQFLQTPLCVKKVLGLLDKAYAIRENRRLSDVDIGLVASMRRAAHWPLWGVLLTGVFSALLWEHGIDLLGRSPTLVGLALLPVVGGVFTPEKPWYTIVVFAIGSVPPINDVFTPIGSWPIGLMLDLVRKRPITLSALVGLPFVLLFAVYAAAIMSVLYAPFVLFGWSLRRSLRLD